MINFLYNPIFNYRRKMYTTLLITLLLIFLYFFIASNSLPTPVNMGIQYINSPGEDSIIGPNGWLIPDPSLIK
jgi:hypothetical protein